MSQINLDNLKSPEEINSLIYSLELDRSQFLKSIALVELDIVKWNAVIEQDISNDKSLKNDQERKARRYDLQISDPYNQLQLKLIDLLYEKNQCEAALSYTKNALKILLNLK